MDPNKRTKIQNLVISVMRTLDPTQTNAKKYQNMFIKMNDSQFEAWVKDLITNPNANLRLDVEEFNRERVLMMDNVKKAAELIHVPLWETVYFPHLSNDPQHPVSTSMPVLVGYLNVKRLEQFNTKKTGLAYSDRKRDENTGQVKGDDKAGKTSGIESEVLAGVGADNVISEFEGVRGDNLAEYNNMIRSISTNGSVKLADIKTGIYDKPTVIQMDLYLNAMGIKTDIVSPSYYAVGKIKTIQQDVNNK